MYGLLFLSSKLERKEGYACHICRKGCKRCRKWKFQAQKMVSFGD